MTLQPLGTLQAGFPSPAGDYMEDRIDLNKELIQRPHSTFIFRVTGDSMIGAFIPPNALLVVDRVEKVRNNAIIVAILNGEFTVKRLVRSDSHTLLLPENKKYRPIEITECTRFEVWGVVTHIITDAKTV